MQLHHRTPLNKISILYKKKFKIIQLLITCLRALLLVVLKSYIAIFSTTNTKKHDACNGGIIAKKF